MNDLDSPRGEMIACSTIDKQAAAPTPWWDGLTPDQQDEALDRIDPRECPPGSQPAMTFKQWKREKRRVRSQRNQWIRDIAALRVPCQCDNCVEHRADPFPRYYVINGISYECWLESHVEDDEIEEFLAPLRNDRDRVGSVVIGRKPPKQRNIPC